jgi:hypothetical protein
MVQVDVHKKSGELRCSVQFESHENADKWIQGNIPTWGGDGFPIKKDLFAQTAANKDVSYSTEEILIAVLFNDTKAIKDLRLRVSRKYFVDQTKGSSVGNIIIKNETGYQIISVPNGANHSGMIGKAPDGFGPGDEKYLKISHPSLLHSPVISIDWKAKMASHQKAIEKKNWNQMSIWERVKSKWKR